MICDFPKAGFSHAVNILNISNDDSILLMILIMLTVCSAKKKSSRLQ